MANENQNMHHKISVSDGGMDTSQRGTDGGKASPNMIPLAIIIAGLIIAGAVIYSRGVPAGSPTASGGSDGSAQPSSLPRPAASSVNIENVDLAGEPFIGDPNAPVTLAYWFDFQCPFCKRFETGTLPALVEQYVKTGKLKIVFKDFQFLGPDSQTAGLAEKAVWELYPKLYFKWHQAMYEKQDAENSGFGSKEDIIALAGTVPGIDADAISRLMDQKKDEYQQEQDADKAEGTQFGINGTPGFVLGTQRISGAQPTGVFTQLIDSELGS